jgi:hypothetical protein
MLLPVKLAKTNQTLSILTLEEKSTKNIFIPKEIEVQEKGLYSIHFASIISAIKPTDYKMINQQLDTITRFTDFRKEVREIDYADFQRFGDYSKFCGGRYQKYFGK